jgi:hypothetical protein
MSQCAPTKAATVSSSQRRKQAKQVARCTRRENPGYRPMGGGGGGGGGATNDVFAPGRQKLLRSHCQRRLAAPSSASAIECCLIQWTDDGVENPAAFASAKLPPTKTCTGLPSNWKRLLLFGRFINIARGYFYRR